MAVELYDGVNNDGLFNVLGKAFYAQKTLNTARLTTVPTEVLDALTSFELLPITDKLARTITGVAPALQGFQGSGNSLAAALQSYCGQLLIEMVDADTKLDQKTLAFALKELIRQMDASSDTVDASAITLSVSASGSNNGNGVLILSKKRGDGLVQENALSETLTAEVTADGAPATATITISGDESESNLLSEQWPRGSSARRSISCTDAASSLLANGDMEDEDDRDNTPDDWVVSVGTIGTTIKMTDVEVQTIAMSGSPSAGTYTITYSNAAGKAQTTGPLSYDAPSSAVQAALRLLKGLELITVSESGTSPNLTHTITFFGVGGDVTQLTSTNNTTGGTLTHGTTTAGTANVFAGSKALWLISNGSELTTLNQRLTALKAETAYAFSAWLVADAVPAAGVLTIDLVDGIGGSVISDAQGVANSFTFNASSLTTSWKHISTLVSGECVFRTPTIVPPIVYLRIRISTAITNARQVFIDHVALAEMTELYSGGPMIQAFSGNADFKVKDRFTITVTNDRAGELQEWFNRNFGMASLGLLLPSDSGGTETIPDSVVG